MDGEIWKPVKGWEGYYEISNMGRARSVTRQADVYVRGTDHAFHKLTEEDVRWIRANEGTMSQREMADVFGVCHSTIGNVQRRKQWAHV